MGFNPFGKKKGFQCERNPQDGSQTCTRFEVDGNQKIATGTVVNISHDPSTCEPVLTGDINSILDDEAEDIKRIAKAVSASCRKGIA